MPAQAFALSEFRRANSNSDEKVDISDALYTLGFLFLGGPGPACDDAADANDDGELDISDGLYTLGYLFLGTRAPPAPGPDTLGPDPTPDDLTCGHELRCDSPADGALVDLVPGAGVSIRGTAIGLFDVRVNGEPAEVAPDHTFSATVEGRNGLNFVELSARDSAGATHTGLCMFLGAERWLEEGAQLDEALAFRVEPAGFNKLTSILPGWFNANLAPTLDRSLLAGNPLIEMDCGAFGSCVTEIRYLSSSVHIDFVNLSVTSSSTLNVTVQLDLSLRLRVRSKQGGVNRPAAEGEVIFTNASVDVDVALGIDPATHRPYAVGQEFNSVQAGTVSTQFPGLDPELRSTVVSVAQDSALGILGTEVLNGSAGLFEGLLAGTDVTLPDAGISVPRLDGAGDVTVELQTGWAVVLRNQGLTLLAGLRTVSPSPPAAATGRIPLRPEDGPVEGVLSRPADAWSASHAGVFNQVLYMLWREGLFDGTVDASALGPGLPAGTSLSVETRMMPVVTGFDPAGTIGLDVGALALVVTHPDLPPGLRVTAGARVRARASLLSGDLTFDDIVLDELKISTGEIPLDAPSQTTLRGLVERLLGKLADVALNDSFPVLPAIAVTIPQALAAYGLPVGSPLAGAPRLVLETNHVFLEGNIGVGP